MAPPEDAATFHENREPEKVAAEVLEAAVKLRTPAQMAPPIPARFCEKLEAVTVRGVAETKSPPPEHDEGGQRLLWKRHWWMRALPQSWTYTAPLIVPLPRCTMLEDKATGPLRLLKTTALPEGAVLLSKRVVLTKQETPVEAETAPP